MRPSVGKKTALRDAAIAAASLGVFAISSQSIGPDFLAHAWVATGLALVAAVAFRVGAARLLALAGFGVALTLALFESGFSLVEKFSRTTYFGDHYADYYDSPDPLLGYRVRPSRRVHATKHTADGSEIYAVDYTIGEHQTRVTPGNEEGSKIGTVIFLGGSLAFGEGLEDDETLPYRFSQATGFRYRVLNYGLHGYGPHQALRTLELGLPDVQTVGAVAAIVYVLFPSHPERAAGEVRWDPQGPAYSLAADGTPRYEGPFSDPERPLLQGLRRSRLYERLRGLWALSEEEKLELTTALLASLRELARERYGAPFFVVYWDFVVYRNDPGGRSLRLLRALEEAEFAVLLASEAIPVSRVASSTIPRDGHPSALAHQYLGPRLAERLTP